MKSERTLWQRAKMIQVSVRIWQLHFDFHPLSWSKLYFKTGQSILRHGRTFQLFAGPLHVWRFKGGAHLHFAISIEAKGGFFGREKPVGVDAIPFLWGWLRGKNTWLPKAEDV